MFYPIEIKFRHNTDGLLDHMIGVSSNNKHVEAKFPDGMSFSSTIRKEALNGGNGPRFKHIGYSHPEWWTTYILWVTSEELASIYFDCEVLVDQELGYDTIGAVGTAGTGSQAAWKWFCSEVVYDRICCRWLPTRMNFKMDPDALEDVVVKLAASLERRKQRA